MLERLGDQVDEDTDDIREIVQLGLPGIGEDTVVGPAPTPPAEAAAPRDEAIATAIDELTDVLTLLGQSEARARVQAALQALESIDG